MKHRWVTIRHYSFIWEAELDKTSLETAGIPVALNNAQTLSVQTFLADPGEGIGLAVPEGRETDAKQLLEQDFSASLDDDE